MGNIFHNIYIANISTILIVITVLLLVWSVIGAVFAAVPQNDLTDVVERTQLSVDC